MEKIKIYLHGENTREIVEVDIDESSSHEEILIKFKESHGGGESSVPYIISIQNDDDDCDDTSHMHDHHAPLKHKGHIHCHRCEKISTKITYNGVEHVFKFEPSITGKKVFKKAINQFGITPNDATGMQLKFLDNTILQSTDHVGSFTKYPECKITLVLANKVNIQG